MELIEEGLKQTEVGLIPEDWGIASLSEITEKVMVGIASAATHAYRKRGIVLFRNQNIKPNYLDDSDILFISESYEEQFKGKRLQGGDLLTARTGYPGTTCVIPEKYKNTQSFTTLISRPIKTKVDKFYLSFYINSEQGFSFFERSKIGGGQKNVNAAILKLMPIPLPPTLNEQQAIATALSDVDALISSLDGLIAKKKAIKQGAMQQLLTPPSKGGKRLPGFDGEWEERKIGDFTLVKAGGTPRTDNNDYWGGDIPWMNSGELNLKFVNQVGTYITEQGLKNSSTNLIPKHSVLIGLAGQGKTRGTAALNLIDLCTNQSIAAILPGLEHNFLYVYYFMDLMYDELRKLSTGDGGRGGLNLSIIKNVSVPFPKLEEQKAIAEILNDMDTELEQLETKKAKYQQIKQGMMQELLTGKTRLV